MRRKSARSLPSVRSFASSQNVSIFCQYMLFAGQPRRFRSAPIVPTPGRECDHGYRAQSAGVTSASTALGCSRGHVGRPAAACTDGQATHRLRIPDPTRQGLLTICLKARLEQRNGRIDLYGQLKTPIVSFLYASDTYEGEVLARLVEKIERQMHRLGSIGDVLGQIQVEHIEQLLSRPPDDLNAAIRQADQEIEAELARLATASLHGILGAGHLNQEEVNQAKKAADQGNSESVDLADFLCRAVVGAGGRVERSDRIRVWTPPFWQSGSIPPFYQDLLPLTPATSLEGDEENLLDEGHALLKEAIRWVKASRFNPGDDHRLAYVCTPDISEPDLVATFLIQVRDGEGRETERLEAVLVTPDVRVSSERDADLEALRTEGPGNVPPDVLERLFGTWWQSAREAALTKARRRAAGWRQAIIALRMLSQDQFQQELEIWNSAVRKVILRDHTSSRQLELFGSPDLPPAIKRRLRQHEERYHQRRAFLDQRIKFDAPAVEPLGVLLRVPASALNP